MTPSTGQQRQETRARRAIRRAVEAKGARIYSMEFEAMRNGAEKSGLEGGWCVEVEAPWGFDHALGYNWREVIEWIESSWPKEIP